MLRSMTSSMAPMATATATAHLLTTRAGAAAAGIPVTTAPATVPSPGVHGELHAHSGAQAHGRRDVVEMHAHGEPLHDLREIAGREGRAAAPRARASPR